MVQAQADGLADGRKIMADARAADAANTATPEQLSMVQAQADGLADGRKIVADARAAVAANTVTPEQLSMVQSGGAGWARALAHVRPEVPRPEAGPGGVTKPPCATCTLRSTVVDKPPKSIINVITHQRI